MRQAKQVHSGFVQTNATQLYYEMAGSGHPLVLLHGGYLDRRMWDAQFAAFAQDYQVIRYDIRGFGKSALPQVPYADREDLCDLLTFLDIEKSYLLGFSLGGGIALDFTLEHPERVDALMLVGSPINGARPRDVLTEEEEQAFRIQQQPLDPSAWGRLHEIAVPTLLLVGEKDDIALHRFADKLEREISGARRVTIAGTHHMTNMEKPEEFTRIILDFLKTL